MPDPTGSDQSIEPGQRECTALVEMPNFIPKIEFITVANWFRTSEVGDGQKSDLEKASMLGRKLVLAEEALNRSQVEGHYRPEEYQIATERLNQLKSLMPTQRMVVRVPFTDNQNDARIFCSHGSQLRPALSGWHGKPPEEGDETTLFLEGKNFSIHDTHVIAGGKLAPSVLVSRQLSRGHDSQRRLSHAERERNLAARHQCRDAQRRVESSPHQDAARPILVANNITTKKPASRPTDPNRPPRRAPRRTMPVRPQSRRVRRSEQDRQSQCQANPEHAARTKTPRPHPAP